MTSDVATEETTGEAIEAPLATRRSDSTAVFIGVLAGGVALLIISIAAAVTLGPASLGYGTCTPSSASTGESARLA